MLIYNGMLTNHYIRGFDMKKRVMIYVDSDDWVDVRLKSVGLGISAGDYLIGLHKGGLVVNPKVETVEFKEQANTTFSEFAVKEKVDEAEDGKINTFVPHSKTKQLGKK